MMANGRDERGEKEMARRVERTMKGAAAGAESNRPAYFGLPACLLLLPLPVRLVLCVCHVTTSQAGAHKLGSGHWSGEGVTRG